MLLFACKETKRKGNNMKKKSKKEKKLTTLWLVEWVDPHTL
jgi:hypothetical protein